MPWATVTTFAGDRTRESVDLVSDLDGTIGGNSMSLGALPSYDLPSTVNGNIKLTTSGTFSIATNINALGD